MLKEILNIEGLFVLTVGYVDITIYLPTKYYYIIEIVYFIHRLFVLFISTLSSLTSLTNMIRFYFHLSLCHVLENNQFKQKNLVHVALASSVRS